MGRACGQRGDFTLMPGLVQRPVLEDQNKRASGQCLCQNGMASPSHITSLQIWALWRPRMSPNNLGGRGPSKRWAVVLQGD